MLRLLAKDRFGIGYCGMHYRHPDTKAVALGASENGPWYEPTKENCIERTYPLTRAIVGFTNRPAPPHVVEFLRYILSSQGQAAVVREGDYLPLNGAVVRAQRKELE